MKIFALKRLFILTSFALLILLSASLLYGMNIEAHGWREHYRNKIFLIMLQDRVDDALLNYVSDNSDIMRVIDLVKAKKEHDALNMLQEMISSDASFNAEAVYMRGLINEWLGFDVEAKANYSIFKEKVGKSPFYDRALLRLNILEMVEGMSNRDMASLKDIAGRFYILYKDSTEPLVWQEALAAYGVALFLTGKSTYAAEVFNLVDDYVRKRPFYRFFRFENLFYMSEFEIDKVADFYKELSDKYSDSQFLAYILLRFGDALVSKGESDAGKRFYRRILKEEYGVPGRKSLKTGDSEKSIAGLSDIDLNSGKSDEDDRDSLNKAKIEKLSEDRAFAGIMALSELYADENDPKRGAETLELIVDRLKEPVYRSMVLKFLVSLFEKAGNDEKVLFYAKKFLSSKVLGKGVKSSFNRAFNRLVSGKYKKKDYRTVAELYYRNRGYVDDKHALFIVGKSFLSLDIPEEAEKIFKRIKGNAQKMDSDIMLGLARSYIMKGDAKKASRMLVGLKSRRLNKNRRGMETAFRLLGDLQFRKGHYADALDAYLNTDKGAGDPELYLKEAFIYEMVGKKQTALGLFRDIVKRAPQKDIKARAFINMGNILYSLKRWKDALNAYTAGVESIESEGERLWALYRMGEINSILKRKDDAVKAWKNVAESGGGYLSELAQERLKEFDL